MAVEEPRYTVLVSDPPFEVRRYAAFTVAQTQISGDFDAASRSGFRRIASYIFGDNMQAGLGAQRKISMTAPVTLVPETEGWRMHFVMPSAESLQTLPQPLNPQIQLRPVPEHETVAVRFSGITTQASIQEQTERLRAWAQARQLKLSPTAQIARYDDPFTLPIKPDRKVPATIRLSPEVSSAFRATGHGWQTRIDAALKDWLRTHFPSAEAGH
eukprot:gene13602-15651_t